MMTIYKWENGGLKEADCFGPSCWINLAEPSTAELEQVLNFSQVPRDFLTDPLDREERPRYDSDDGTHRFSLTELQHATAPIFYETNAITVKTSEEKLIKNRNKTFGNRLYPKDSHYYIANLQSVDVVYVDEGSIINGTFVNDKAHVYMPLEKE